MPTKKPLGGFGPTPSCMLNPKSRVGAQQSGSRHVPVGMGPLFCCRPEFSHLQDGGEKAIFRWWGSRACQHLVLLKSLAQVGLLFPRAHGNVPGLLGEQVGWV